MFLSSRKPMPQQQVYQAALHLVSGAAGTAQAHPAATKAEVFEMHSIW